MNDASRPISKTSAAGLLSGTISVLLMGCGPDERAAGPVPSATLQVGGERVFVPMDEEPTYHLLDGYDPRWSVQLREGIEMGRKYWGGFGPAHVWVVGREGEGSIDRVAREAFIDEYCGWRIAGLDRTMEECRVHATERFIDVAERGEPEAYLSWVDEFDQPEAELVFINVHRWYLEDDPVPDPVLRGIHEYTHVFQMGFGSMPTWMMEGAAVFSESWIPWVEGRCGFDVVSRRMGRLLDRIERMEDSDLTIADMEDIDSASQAARDHHRELAYDAGAWAVVFLVHGSPSGSMAAFRDEFFPMVTTLGWERALVEYLGIESIAAFYEGFEDFMASPRRTRLIVLGEIGR